MAESSTPQPAGYSKRPLRDKLGIESGDRVAFLNAPDHYPELLGPLPEGATEAGPRQKGLAFVHLFCSRRADLEKQFPRAKARIADDGMLWVSWPKGASKLPADLNENIVRDVGLANGLVDVKVAAIDADWSGLKFVYRLEDRGG